MSKPLEAVLTDHTKAANDHAIENWIAIKKLSQHLERIQLQHLVRNLECCLAETRKRLELLQQEFTDKVTPMELSINRLEFHVLEHDDCFQKFS
ncbi:hypothetical protein PtB15_7B380 [Puccinia triticina]|nr:hypothetical protein PtB15_7B380 [Puccinia triticina]